MLNDKDVDNFLQWQKDTGRMKYELTDIAINDNGNIKFEKQMVWVSHNTPDDWREFCKDTGRKYEGAYELIAYAKNT
jgi:hypothetical protein